MFTERLFWDGRVESLEEQAKQPLINQFEMGLGEYRAVVDRVAAIPEYRIGFQRTFGSEGITIETIVKAIAAYERIQLSGNSPFDRFMAGNPSAITAAQKRGFELFKGKGLKIYEPDVAAFRKYAQEKYQGSDLAKDWPAGMVDKINAL